MGTSILGTRAAPAEATGEAATAVVAMAVAATVVAGLVAATEVGLVTAEALAEARLEAGLKGVGGPEVRTADQSIDRLQAGGFSR